MASEHKKNKATAGHLGLLKARLARLKREVLMPSGGKVGQAWRGFDASQSLVTLRVWVYWFPTCWKIHLLTKLQDGMEFSMTTNTTLFCIPGSLQIQGCKFSSWICQESLKERRNGKVVDAKSSPLPGLAI